MGSATTSAAGSSTASSKRRSEPILAVVAGPSGVGKGTLVRALMAREPRWWLSVSATTRGPRPGEVDGRDYWFLDEETFALRERAGGFLEAFEVYGARYGTPAEPVRARLATGEDVLVEVDVQGALAIRAQVPEAVLVFLRPPSRAALEARLRARDPRADPADLDRRLGQSAAEEALAGRFDAVVVNDDVDRAVSEVAAILDRRRRAG